MTDDGSKDDGASSVIIMSIGEKQKSLQERDFSYDTVGITQPGDETWEATGPRPFEITVKVSDNPGDFERLSHALMNWTIKTRSGFTVEPHEPAAGASNYWLIASIGPLKIREPARVVKVVNEPDRKGFAYGTLTGHPVSGEEAFILSRREDGAYLTLRSITAPGAGIWGYLFPLTLLAQRVYRRRYLKALLKH